MFRKLYTNTTNLRKINKVSFSYNIGKLCTEDRILVSRMFSLKVSHCYNERCSFWYSRSFLLWIRDAPVIGQDNPDEILSWIQKKVTCHILDKKTSPDLHILVTRYQMHKCNAYCKQKVSGAVLSLPDADLGSLARWVKAL